MHNSDQVLKKCHDTFFFTKARPVEEADKWKDERGRRAKTERGQSDRLQKKEALVVFIGCLLFSVLRDESTDPPGSFIFNGREGRLCSVSEPECNVIVSHY